MKELNPTSMKHLRTILGKNSSKYLIWLQMKFLDDLVKETWPLLVILKD